jgi:outer membrane protein assembly factor BamB
MIAGVLLLASLSAAPDPMAERFWPQWRGPYANGVSKHADPPLEWSETKNIRWKVEIPGRGSASPVVWGDRIFLLSAVPLSLTGAAAHSPQGGVQPRNRHRFIVLAIDRKTGKTLWQRVARENRPHEASHQDNGTYASSSAITDGRRVFAWFESQGMYVYDMDGKLLWSKDLGDKRMRSEFGEGSTPVLYGDRLVIVWDHIAGPSFIVSLDKLTGKELWRVERDEKSNWATPYVWENEKRTELVTAGSKRVRSYSLDGKPLWELAGMSMIAIPTPFAKDGLLYVCSGYVRDNTRPVYAIRPADLEDYLRSADREPRGRPRSQPKRRKGNGA